MRRISFRIDTPLFRLLFGLILWFNILIPPAASGFTLFSSADDPLVVDISEVMSLEYDTSREYAIYSIEEVRGEGYDELDPGKALVSSALEERLRIREFWYLSNQLSLGLSKSWIRSGIQLDLDGIRPNDLNISENDLDEFGLMNPSAEFEQSVHLSRYFVETDIREVNVRAGDFFLNIAKGISANISPQSYRSQENMIKGGIVRFIGDSLTFQAFGGLLEYYDRLQNPISNARNENLRYEGYLAGSELSLRLFDYLDLGVHLVSGRYDSANEEPPFVIGWNYLTSEELEFDTKFQQSHILGTKIDIPNMADGALSFFAEFDYAFSPFLIEIDQTYPADVEPDYQSYGLYSSLNAFMGNWTALFEFKKYKNFGYLWNNPPTLEMDGIAFKKMNVLGGRGRLNYHVQESDSTLFVNLGYFEDEDFGGLYKLAYEGGGISDMKSLHLYGGIEQPIGMLSHFAATVGYRYMFGDLTDSGEYSLTGDPWEAKINSNGRLAHAQFVYKTSVKPNLGLEFSFKFYDFRVKADDSEYVAIQIKDLNQQLNEESDPEFRAELTELLTYYQRPGAGETISDFVDEEGSVSLILYQKLTVGALFDYYTLGVGEDEKKSHPGLLTKYKISESSFVSFFYGSRKKGFQCTGGECREYPAFEGFKFELNIRL